MSCSKWLSIQSSLVIATPVDSHCVSPELRQFGATRTSTPSTPFNTRASLPCSRQTHRTLSERGPDQVSELLWRRRRIRRSSLLLYLFHLALPFGEALLHSLFSFSCHLGGIRYEAPEFRRNGPP